MTFLVAILYTWEINIWSTNIHLVLNCNHILPWERKCGVCFLLLLTNKCHTCNVHVFYFKRLSKSFVLYKWGKHCWKNLRNELRNLRKIFPTVIKDLCKMLLRNQNPEILFAISPYSPPVFRLHCNPGK